MLGAGVLKGLDEWMDVLVRLDWKQDVVLGHYIPYSILELSIAKASVGLGISHRTTSLGIGDESETI